MKREGDLLPEISCPWWEIKKGNSGSISRRRTGWLRPGEPFGILRGGAEIEEKENLTNGEVLDWYLELMRNGAVTQENIKEAALCFFGESIQEVDKKTIHNKLKQFKKDQFPSSFSSPHGFLMNIIL